MCKSVAHSTAEMVFSIIVIRVRSKCHSPGMQATKDCIGAHWQIIHAKPEIVFSHSDALAGDRVGLHCAIDLLYAPVRGLLHSIIILGHPEIIAAC